jgi:dihydroxyacetone kinase
MPHTDGGEDKVWSIRPTKIYAGSFETSLNGPGFSITLCNLTLAATTSKTTVDELMGLLASETKAPAWPNVLSNMSTRNIRKEPIEVDIDKETEFSADEDIKGKLDLPNDRTNAKNP